MRTTEIRGSAQHYDRVLLSQPEDALPHADVLDHVLGQVLESGPRKQPREERDYHKRGGGDMARTQQTMMCVREK